MLFFLLSKYPYGILDLVMDMKKIKPIKMCIIIFLIFGVVYTAFGAAFTIVNIKIKSNCIPVEAEIIDFETYYDSDHDKHTKTIVKYSVDNQEYTDKINSYNSSWDIGDSIDVYYDPQNPQKIESEMPIVLCFVFGLLGVAFLITSIVLIIKQKNKNAKRRNLIQNGLVVNAEIVRFYENTRISVNKRYPFIIEADYNDGSNTHRFRSDNVWENVTTACIGKTVKVYYEPNNMNNYYVDTAGLFNEFYRINDNIIYH